MVTHAAEQERVIGTPSRVGALDRLIEPAPRTAPRGSRPSGRLSPDGRAGGLCRGGRLALRPLALTRPPAESLHRGGREDIDRERLQVADEQATTAG